MPGNMTFEELSERKSKHFFDAINNEDPLACVLVSVSFIEQCLRSLLELHFIDTKTARGMLDPDKDGYLTDLMKRARLAYALGLIPEKAYASLARFIRSIRYPSLSGSSIPRAVLVSMKCNSR